MPRVRCSAAAASGPAARRDAAGPARGRPRAPAPAASGPALSSAGATGHPRGCPGAALTRLLLLLLLLSLLAPRVAGLGEPGATTNGRALAVCTPRAAESRAFTCRAPRLAPGAALAWYRDGRRQEANCSAAGATRALRAAAPRADRRLSCSLTDPASGETYNASLLLDAQYKPEVLWAGARYQEAEGARLLLVLLVLAQGTPPAHVSWRDQDGRVTANASDVLLTGAARSPAPANHSLRVRVGSATGNISASGVGVATASLLPTGLLGARVELPLVGVGVGAALALGALLSLGSCAACLACRRAKPQPATGPVGRSSSREHPPPAGRLPRQTRSLPPDLRLGDLSQEPTAASGDARAGARAEESAVPGVENPPLLSRLGGGFVRLPASGRIYRVPSTSSDEIWL